MVQSEDSQHHKEVVLADITLLKVWAAAVWMPANSDLINCKCHILVLITLTCAQHNRMKGLPLWREAYHWLWHQGH